MSRHLPLDRKEETVTVRDQNSHILVGRGSTTAEAQEVPQTSVCAWTYGFASNMEIHDTWYVALRLLVRATIPGC